MTARTRRIVSIALPHLPTDRIAQARWGRSWICDGRPEAPPLVVTETAQNALRLKAVEPEAGRHGLVPGQTLADARALCPALEAVTHDPAADAALVAALAAWCDRYAPLVGLSGSDGLMLDVTGCAHLFGGEEALLDDIAARLTAQGLHVRTGLADTPGAAWALARFGTTRHAAPGEQKAALAALPLAALRIPPEVAAGLARVGLRTVSCIAELPRAPLARRFGAELMRRLDQALGREDEAISPLTPLPELSAERRFAEPIGLSADIERATVLLAETLAPMLAQRGVGARALELRLFRVDGAVERLAVAAANPLRAPGRIAALFAERIRGLRHEIDAGFGFELVKLAVLETERFDGAQGDMIAGGRAEDGFSALVDRLGARLGPERVRGFVGADTHIPERAFATLPLTRLRAGSPAAGPAAARPAPPLTRPVWLLARPEPVEALAEVPDGPPLRFRWRRTPYEVARAEGPERIACEWWRDGRGAPTRDYFRVEDPAGHRFWMFRHGLYGRETVRPRWYMHGVFA